MILSSPEYVHGIAGAFKNGLDWLVGSQALAGKPVALINASERARHAHESLGEIISTMGWCVVPSASLNIPISSQDSDPAQLLDRSEVVEPLRQLMAALAAAIAR